MNSAKDIRIINIPSNEARALIKKLHYSGKVVNNSQLHFGVVYNGKLEGVMQFGPPMIKARTLPLVKNTGWSEMLELNRMAFSQVLPRNSESRAISIALRLIKKAYPHIKWILSFADGTQCGDGTIYRASGFLLTQIKKNTSIIRLPSGEIGASITYGKGKHALAQGGRSGVPQGSEKLVGYQFRYIYFLDQESVKNLQCEVIPFAKIKELGAGMYLGEKR